MQLARVLDGDEPLGGSGAGEERAGDRGLARGGAARDEDVHPLGDGAIEELGEAALAREPGDAGETGAALALDADLAAGEETDLIEIEHAGDVFADRERRAVLDRRRHHDLDAERLAEGAQAARDQGMSRPDPVAGLAGEMIGEPAQPLGREAGSGCHHVLGLGALDPDRAVRVHHDFVDRVGDQQLAELAQLVLGMARRGETGRGRGKGAGRDERLVEHQNTRSRATKMVSRSP
nr:hypothetical protein [Amaricoccus solimangrovi]